MVSHPIVLLSILKEGEYDVRGFTSLNILFRHLRWLIIMAKNNRI